MPWRRERLPTLVFWPREFHGLYSPWGRKESDTIECVSLSLSDVILAEGGGVCVMVGCQCCTFIPNCTAPDGPITRALQGLTTLAKELAENSGIDDPLSSLMEQ